MNAWLRPPSHGEYDNVTMSACGRGTCYSHNSTPKQQSNASPCGTHVPGVPTRVRGGGDVVMISDTESEDNEGTAPTQGVTAPLASPMTATFRP